MGHDFAVRRSKWPKRGQDFFDNFDRVLDYALDTRADLVLHAGDLFFRAKIPESIVQLVYKRIYEFSKHNIPLLIVPGNHERSRFPRSPLINNDNVFIFNYPKSFTFDLENTKISVGGFPYIYDSIRDHFTGILRETQLLEQSSDLKILMHHHAMEGSTCGPGNYMFRHNEDVIQKKDVPPEIDLVLCGHIHRNQELKAVSQGKTIPILYSGSSERTAFAEMGEQKGFYHIRVIAEPKPHFEWTFKNLPMRPMHQIVVKEASDTIQNINEYLVSQITQLKPGTLVRIKVEPEDLKKQLNTSFLKEKLANTWFLEFSGLGTFLPRKKKTPRPNLFNQHPET